MARFSMTFTGGKELASALRTLPDALSRQILLGALTEAAEPMRQRMSQLAPREPGKPDIADNIGISVANRLGDIDGGRWEARSEDEHAVAVGPTKNFFYGIFLEYGTVKMRAQPFMRPAFDTEAPRALSQIGNRIWAAIRDRAMSTGGRGL